MRVVHCSLLAFVLLAACAPLRIYHKPNVTVARMNSDRITCEVAALEKAPVASELRRGPPQYLPAYQRCDAAGRCYRRGGYYVQGQLYSVDVNRRLRSEVETQCMARKGYTRVEIPNCPTGTIGTTAQSRTGEPVLPPLTENTCALRGSGRSWTLVAP